MKRSFVWFFLGLTLFLSSCALPQVKAEDRLFQEISLDFLGEYRLPKQNFDGTRVGGLSAITYDRQLDRFYAVSDDRSEHSPARFYTLKLNINPDWFTAQPTNRDQTSLEQQSEQQPKSAIQSVNVEQVTPLRDATGNSFEWGTVDFEGIALSPQRSLFISSEGDSARQIAPFIAEFDLNTGAWLRALPVPDRFLPATTEEGQPIGVQDNRGFEALTLSASGYGGGSLEPYRVFAAIESSLHQDLPFSSQTNSSQPASPQDPVSQDPVRFLHYLVGELPSLLSEHLYWVEAPPERATMNGLAELATLDQAGHFLSLERSFGLLTGFNAQIFQLATGGATDISGIPGFRGDTTGITPIYKRLELNLADLGIPLDNLEGMTIGPRLPDGTQSLVLISDDNFNPLQATQVLLFRLKVGNG